MKELKFNQEKLAIKELENKIGDLYNKDSKTPRIFHFRGDNVSLMLLIILLNVIQNNPQNKKLIKVIYTESTIENPITQGYSLKVLESLKSEALRENLNIKIEKIMPRDTFWFNVIGKGMLIPTSNKFAWCIYSLKSKPMEEYLKENLKQYEKILVISSTYNEDEYTKGSELYDNLTIYTPLNNIDEELLWNFLLLNNNLTWRKHAENLFILYKNMYSIKCPLYEKKTNLVDKVLFPCTSSAYSCWMCSIKNDNLENLINEGEEWLISLLDFKNYIRDICKNKEYKNEKNRIDIKTRKMLLDKLKKVQEKLEFEILLISEDEEDLIRNYWLLGE